MQKLSYRSLYPEKIHSLTSLYVVVLSLAMMFIAGHTLVFLTTFALTCGYFFYLGLSLLHFLKVVIYTLGFAAFYLLMMLLFPGGDSFFYGKQLLAVFSSVDFLTSKEFTVFQRLFFVSTISVCALTVIRIEVVLLALAQKNRISVMFVYPLLFALSSITLLKHKYELYVFNARLRKLKGFLLPRLLFQFLVFVLRFSESGALSLIARGLSPQKKSYYDFNDKSG